MSNRQEIYEIASEFDSKVKSEDEDYEEYCYSDDDDSSSYSDDQRKFEDDDEILERIAQVREQEIREKDLRQIKDFPVDIRKYDWKCPENIEGVNNEGFPGLLECIPQNQNFVNSTKTRKGAGFTRHMPEIVFGDTGISIKSAKCVHFLRGNCTRENCTFYHPTDEKCKFDKKCNNQRCVYLHSPRDEGKIVFNPKTIQKNNTSVPRTGEKCKHRICLNIFKIEDNKLKTTQRKCKHGDNCSFAHSTKEIKEAINANKERFKCNFEKKCIHVSFEISNVVINNEPTKIYKYQNITEFCGCPRVHPKESISNFSVRVHAGRKPQPKPLINTV